MYGALHDSVEVVRPSKNEMTTVNAIYMELARRGISSAENEHTITELAERVLAREQLDAIILAGTDFSVMFDDHRPAFPYLDATDIHVQALTQRFLADSSQ